MAAIILTGCTRCGACLDECPSKAIIPAAPLFVVDADLCDEHLRCLTVCPEGVIQVQKK